MDATRCKDRQTFLARLRQSNLLRLEDFANLAAQLPDTDKAGLLARFLVERGALTRFQAEMLLAGRTSGFVFGQYRILDEIGRGGMGRVYKAMHATMHRLVAVKVLSSKFLKTERAQKLFQREVRAAAKLVHPNIVTAYDADLVGDRHYMVLEFVDGPNLERLVREHGPLTVGQACEFARQVATGLQFAFERGMVHRDIKPANLLVQGSGPLTLPSSPARGEGTTAPSPLAGEEGRVRGGCTVKILDFGLARLHTPSGDGRPDESSILAENNAVLGTPDYVSPEQAQNVHAADIRSDLYSLGCTLFFLLTGQPPFPGGRLLDKVARHTKEKAPRVEKLRPDVPPAVSHIVEKLLAKKPAERFQTPAELAAALEPFAVDAPPPWLTVPTDGDGATAPVVTEFPELEEHLARVARPPSDSVLTPEEEIQLPPAGQPSRLRYPLMVLGAAILGGIGAYILSLFVK